MLLRSFNRKTTGRRVLSHEPLEDRQLLTVIADGWSSPNAYRVPQDSEGTEIDLGGYPRTVDSVELESPTHGTVTLTENGVATYVPNKGFLGVDSFQYTYQVGTESQTTTAYVNVTETVYAIPDWAPVDPHSQPISIDVLENDYATGRHELRLESVSEAAHGTVSLNDQGTQLVYTPDAGFTGQDRLSYIVVDSYGHESVGTVTVDVRAGASSIEGVSSYEHFLVEALASEVSRSKYLFGAPVVPSYSLWLDEAVLFQGDTTRFTAASTTPELSVEDGDIVKLDGDRLYLAAGQQLRIVDVSDAARPQLLDELSFGKPIVDLYSFEDRLTVITEVPGSLDHAIGTVWLTDQSLWTSRDYGFSVHVLDVSQPANTQLVFSTDIEGDYRNSRFVNGTLYTVSSLSMWMSGVGPAVAEGETRFYESIGDYVERFTSDGFSLNTYEVTNAGGTVSGDLFTWQEIRESFLFNPTDHLTEVITFDTRGVEGAPIDVELSDIHTSSFEVYASTEALYLIHDHGWAGSDVLGSNAPSLTIEKFDFQNDGNGVQRVAEGRVAGTLSDQFSADEHNGYFRIATTTGWSDAVSLFVMSQVGSTLEVVGSIEDIAPGERIYSTRFDGGRAFVTTFRVVDPLFVIDVSDPTAPTVSGELKIPGYSNYMQVVSEDHVLGIGRAATETGRVGGLQISLFNVSNPVEPRLVAQQVLGDLGTRTPLAGFRQLTEHHAVTYVAEEGVLALPTYSNTSGAWENAAINVFQIDVDQETIETLGQIDFAERAERSVHVDGHLYGISSSTVKVTELLEPELIVSTLDLTTAQPTSIDELQQRAMRTDLNGDGVTAPADLAYIYTTFRENGFGEMDGELDTMVDVDQNGHFTPHDVLAVINALEVSAKLATVTPVAISAAVDSSDLDDEDSDRTDAFDFVFAELSV